MKEDWEEFLKERKKEWEEYIEDSKKEIEIRMKEFYDHFKVDE